MRLCRYELCALIEVAIVHLILAKDDTCMAMGFVPKCAYNLTIK